RWDDAQTWARRAQNPVLKDAVTWFRLRSDPKASAEQIGAFLTAHPNWPMAATLQAKGESDITGRQDGAALTAWLLQFPPKTNGGRVHYLSMMDQDASVPRSFIKSYAVFLWRTGDFSEDEASDFIARYGDFLRAEDHFVRASQLVWDKKYNQLPMMRGYLSPAAWDVIEARKALKTKSRRAAQAASAVSGRYRDDAGFLFDAAVYAYDAKKNEDMARFLGRIPPTATVLEPDKLWKYQSIVVRRLLKEGEDKKAYAFAANNHQNDGEGLAEAEFLAGFIALKKLGWAEQSAVHFHRLHDAVETPISQARGAYWLAESYAALNDTEKQQQYLEDAARHPTTFYGQLALSKLERKGALPEPPSATPLASAPSEFQRFIGILGALNTLGEDKRMAPFARHTFETFEDVGLRVTLLDHLVRWGRMNLSVALAKKAKNDGQSLVMFEFPSQLSYMKNLSTEKPLALAITRQESVFQVDARSPVGAMGLMQLMPGTAKMTAKQLGVGYNQAALTRDPHYNVMLGSAHLEMLLEDFDGAYPMAIAAYNAGSGAVRRWIRDNGDPRYQTPTHMLDWIENIPYRETRNYVQRVLEGLEVYRMHLNASLPVRDQKTMNLAWCRATCTGESVP
ncbi:MAG: lytic transglycosylase domain-containing protein, partial [Alphaproteobacteria bacterium]